MSGGSSEAVLDELRGFLSARPGEAHPLFPGAVVSYARDGRQRVRAAMGFAVRYADAQGTELPVSERVPMTPETIFDMASVSKLFTSIVVMQAVEAGRIELGRPVSAYLPRFAKHGKEAVTVEQLLTHTSGLPSWLPLWRDHPDRESRIAGALEAEPEAPAGTLYTYSDLNLITLGALVEMVDGERLDVLVRRGITEPLGMADTGYNPPAEKLARIAATEDVADPPRGMIRGQVHDENAWSLGGVAGHAGIFSTVDDMGRLCQAILDGGTHGRRILEPETVELMLTDANGRFPGHAHGLGFELDQDFYMGALASPRTVGHTGFTGTSVVIDLRTRSYVLLLTNRVHPSRTWGSVNPARQVAAKLGLT